MSPQLREGKLKGDVVNIAARLQQIAVPGHMTVSGAVVESIKGRLQFRIRKIGIRRVKNIRQPITVYTVSD